MLAGPQTLVSFHGENEVLNPWSDSLFWGQFRIVNGDDDDDDDDDDDADDGDGGDGDGDDDDDDDDDPQLFGRSKLMIIMMNQ